MSKIQSLEQNIVLEQTNAIGNVSQKEKEKKSTKLRQTNNSTKDANGRGTKQHPPASLLGHQKG